MKPFRETMEYDIFLSYLKPVWIDSNENGQVASLRKFYCYSKN